MEKPERYWILLAKKLSREQLTPEEAAEWALLSGQDREMNMKEEMLDKTVIHTAADISPERKEQMLDAIFGEEQEPPETEESTMAPHKRRPWLVAALLALLIVAGGGYAWLRFPGKTGSAEWSVITTRTGMKSKVILPDGSLVHLNAASTLAYPEDFERNRQVRLTGEGYFEVNARPEYPFVIHTSRMDVKVLGTTLNIRAYPDEARTEAALIKGKVEVTLKKEQRSVLLSPYQKISLANDTEDVAATEPAEPRPDSAVKAGAPVHSSPIALENITPDAKDNLTPETAWVEDKFVFRNEPFEQVAKRMERWYGIEVSFQDETLKQAYFTGNVQQESLPELLKVLQQIKPFKYTINGKNVTIY